MAVIDQKPGNGIWQYLQNQLNIWQAIPLNPHPAPTLPPPCPGRVGAGWGQGGGLAVWPAKCLVDFVNTAKFHYLAFDL